MTDWKKFGEEVAKKREAGWWSCRDCGTWYPSHITDPCAECKFADCVTCGERFLADGWRKRCTDCVGARSDTRAPFPGHRLGGLSDGRP